MIDDKSFKIENQDFLASKNKIKKSKIKKFTGALKSIHTSLFVSEVTIIPLGVSHADDNLKANKASKEEKKRDTSPLPAKSFEAKQAEEIKMQDTID